ncbi:S-DNA-T family DNA segregation ATPase FtsK/SpoIIIE [Cereibacter changlensis]|uniref:DNA translocase FtsK n=3 Tax=Cereibacter changlensis TaxID=402884 RepID=A0A2W7QUE6_9RHOB|nr:DNA translocase FtsK [Cereibacter changlensis]PZX52198.1 S-DNA-T family DNA segregation ATPase FtsK/SpoIIIE [Cereibacter changlensis]
MASYQVRQRDPLLDQNTQAMLERRGRELMGAGLILAGVIFALMLMSYSPEDPGWMVATDEPAQNILGRFGAAVASTLIIIGGMGAWGLPLVLLAWGLRFVLHRGEDRALSRVVFAVIAVALGSVFAATHVPGADWPHSFGLGGLFGDTVLGALLEVTPLGAAMGLKMFSLLAGAGFLAMSLYVCGFDMRELRAIAHFLLVGLVVSYNSLLILVSRGASGSAQAAVAMQDRYRQHREGRAAVAEAAVRDDPVRYGAARQGRVAGQASALASHVPATGAKAAALSFLSRLKPLSGGSEPEPEVIEDYPQAYGRPASLRADQLRAAHARHEAVRAEPMRGADTLRAEPRYAEPEPAPARTGLLARMPQLIRRAPDPESELIEPALSYAASNTDGPSDERIKARINDVIRSRVRQSAPAVSPITAAVAARREPPVARAPGPAPMAADPRRGAPMRLPAEPPVVAAPKAKTFSSGFVASRAALPDAVPLAISALDAMNPMTLPPRLHGASHEDELPLEDQVEDALWQEHEDFDDDSDWVLDPAPEVEQPRLTAQKQVVQPPVKAPAPPARPAAVDPKPRPRFEERQVDYELPPLELLSNPANIVRNPLSVEALEDNARMLESVLEDYGVKGEIVSVRPGPVVTMYELEPAPGLKASRVIGLADDIARSMSALSARVSTVPGRTVIGIELPNATREKVVLREILSARDFGDSAMKLPLALGKDIGGEPIIANLAKMPHLLIAGTTGSGKSVAINTMILSLLYKLTPEECRLIMIDPKMLELSVYDGIPHLLSPVVTDPKKAVVALKWVVGEMEERYRKMSKLGVRNIEGYNGRVREALDRGEMFKRTIQTGFDEDTGEPVFETDEYQPVTIPYIVVVVDEMADLMMVAGKEIEACIQRLAQMARASGIHLIMATQRPSVDVITGTIKANFPTRISFQVTSKIDSRTILGEQGAEQLLGMGDMLYMAGGAKITRIHGPFVSDEEVEEIVNHLKSFGPPTYQSGVVEGLEEDKADDIDLVLGLGGGDGGEDALYDQAVAVVAKDRKCSTSYIQRKLGIGYNKAARLVEQMEENNVVTPANHVGKREILLPEH